MKRIFILLLLIFVSQSYAQQLSLNERNALISIYQSTQGSNWTSNTNWDTNPASTSDVDLWFGIQTDTIAGNIHVVGINLANNNLVDSITDQLLSFPHLKNVQLQNNDLEGIIDIQLNGSNSYDTLYLNNNLIERIEVNGSAVWNTQMQFFNNSNLMSIILNGGVGNFKSISLNQIDVQTRIIDSYHPDSLLHPDDINALEDLVANSNISNYNNLYTFLNHQNRGINLDFVDGDLRIVDLQFYSAGLSDNIPNSMEYMDELKRINFRNNAITHISDTIWNAMDSLLDLDISNNGNYGLLENGIYGLSTLKRFNFRNCSSDELNVNIGLLTNLEYLNFASNDIELIPTNIEFLTQLKTLIAAPNPIASIPTEIGNLVLLEELDFSNCDLTNTPNELGNLVNLEKLYLDNNQIQIIFPGIGNLQNLKNLSLHKNSLTSLPPDFGDLIHLKTLDLSENQLTTIPESFGRLDSLTELNLFKNKLTHLPDSIGYMEHLEVLNINGSSNNTFNNLEKIPTTIGNLSNLKKLYLNGNRIDTIPNSINNLSNLEILEIADQARHISGGQEYYLKYLPTSFSGLSSLERLRMEYNKYEGTVDVSDNHQLKSFNAYNNLLSFLKVATPPSGYSWNAQQNPYLSCIEVETADLPQWNSGGYFIYKDNGVIFSDTCAGNAVPLVERLALIDLYHQCKNPGSVWTNWDTNTTSLSNVGAWYGVTTAVVGGQKHVVSLQINSLVDTIPTSFQSFTQLKTCQLTGHSGTNGIMSLGNGFSQLSNLEELQLNNFSGTELPVDFGNLQNLETLRMNTNYSSHYSPNLTAFPYSMGGLTNLEELRVHRTAVTTLPNSIGQLDSLKEINLFRNKIQQLPDSIGYLENLVRLEVPGHGNGLYNNLTKIPKTIGNLANLKYLDLQYNKIDSIPDEINQLTNLEDLDVSGQSRYVSGSTIYYLKYIPISLNGLTSLKKLDITHNKYQGDLDLSQNAALTGMYLTNNLLTFLRVPTKPNYSSWSALQNPYISCIEVPELDLPLWNNGTFTMQKDNGVIYSDDCSGNKVPHIERLALIDLYKKCKHSGSTWSNWDTNAFSQSNVGAWAGVTTDTINGQKHVVRLDRSALIDTIPSSFQNLTKLEICKMQGYSYTNGIESLGEGFSSLASLKELELNNFSGDSLPTNFGDLSTLEKWSMNTNYSSLISQNLTSLPNSIGGLTHLREVRIHRTEITTLPESIGLLDSLRRINLYRNKLSELPDSIGYIENLEVLEIVGHANGNYNNLTKIPTTIGNLSNLKELDFSYNKIDTLPNEINQLANLEKLDLRGQSRYISGANHYYLKYVPPVFDGLTSLKRIYIGNNQYDGSLDFSHNTVLTNLHLSGNYIPALKVTTQPNYSNWSVVQNPYLSCIEVDSADLPLWNNGTYIISKDNGVIFSDNCNGNAVPLAERLALIDFYKSCKYTTSTWQFWDTNALSLSNVGSWAGVITDTINGQKHVVEIERSSLVDTIPASFQNLTQLRKCKLSASGSNEGLSNLGTGFTSLPNLKELIINDFKGDALPNDFGQLQNLEVLKINESYSYNSSPNLEVLPVSMGDLTNLEELLIQRTEITTLPESFGRLDSLTDLGLTRNKLVSLPDSLGYMDNLEKLIVPGNPNYNQLTNFPTSMGNLTKLKYLNAKNNLIDGDVDLSNSLLLETLYLDHNFISHLKLGVSPSSFGSSSLYSFNVWNNRISCIEVPSDELVSWRLYTQYNKYDDGVGFSDNCGAFSHEVPDQERLALIDFYKEGNGPNWNLSTYENHYDTNILSTENVGVWYGVHVEMLSDSMEHVVNLKVSNKDFRGKILSNIDSLTYLRKLQITNDTIDGVSMDINNLNYLDELLLNSNYIGDTLNFSGLTSLNKLDVYNNQLNGLVLGQHPDSFQYNHSLNLQTNQDLYCVQVPSSYLAAYLSRGFTNIHTNTEFSDDCTGKFTVPTSEKNALIALYNATNGDDWDHNNFWLQNNNVNTWFGVTVEMVNEEKHVTKINLYNNNLVGTIPDEISDLPYLKEINLGYSDLSAGVSPQLGELDSLEQVHLYFSQLSGEIDLSSATKLTLLNLGLNDLNVVKLGAPKSNFISNGLRFNTNPNLTCVEVPSDQISSYQNGPWSNYYVPAYINFTNNCDGPIAKTKSDTVYLDNNGEGIVTASDLDSGSINADSNSLGLSLSISDSVFSCSNIGINTILFTVTDSNGLTDEDSTFVLVLDTVKPVLQLMDTFELFLTSFDSTELNFSQIDLGSTDNCSIDSTHLSEKWFGCSSSGFNSVTVFAFDSSDNYSSVEIIVEVIDTLTGSLQLNESICAGDNFMFGGNSYNISGLYYDTLVNALGCDSIVELNLTVNPMSNNTLNETICQGEEFTVGTSVYNSTGQYFDTLVNALGCDSIVELNLTVNPISNNTLNETICQGEEFTIGASVYNSTGQYYDTLVNALGCDSIVELNLTVNPISNNTSNETICHGEEFTVGTSIYNSTGQYYDTLVNALGCDSVVELNLTVNPISNNTLNETICQGEEFTVGTSVYNSTGQYYDTLVNALGCDSIVELNLTVNPISNNTLNETICQGEEFAVGASVYNSTGQYYDTLVNALGCDSIVELNLTVNPISNNTLNETICQGEEFTVGTSVYNSTGQYYDTLVNALGCDSIVELNLTVNPISNNTLNETICQGEEFTIGASVYNSTGQYYDTLVNALGCDSIVELNLTVNPISNNTLNETICQGEEFTVGTSIYNSTGQYYDTLVNALGCDSIVELNLTVNPISNNTLNETICQGEEFTVGTSVYNSTGQYYDTLVNALGCDSVVELNLTVNPISNNTLNETICQGEEFTVETSIYNSTGQYYDTLVNALGCDSIVELNLTVNPISNNTLNETICQGEEFIVGTSIYNSTGQYYDTLVNALGCDSIVELNLTVNTIDLNVTTSGTQLSAQQNGATYQWLNCEDSTYISGETNQSFTATENGFYAVEISMNGCIDTTDCYEIKGIGIEEANSLHFIEFIPNPTSGQIFIQNLEKSEYSYKITNSLGQEIEKSYLTKPYILDISEHPSGIYFLQIEGYKTTRIFKK